MGRGQTTHGVAVAARRGAEDLHDDSFSAVLGTTRGSGREDATGDAALYRETERCGDIRYYLYKGGPLHREGGPAIIDCNGIEEWWEYGKMLRSVSKVIAAKKRRALLLNWLQEPVSQYPEQNGFTVTELITLTEIYRGNGCYDRCHADLKKLAQESTVIKTNSKTPARWEAVASSAPPVL
jgi:hypothetical protein